MYQARRFHAISWLLVLLSLASLSAGAIPRIGVGAQELLSALPAGTKLDRLDMVGQTVTIYLTLPDHLISSDTFTYAMSDEIVERVVDTLSLQYPHLRYFHVLVKDPADGTFKPISSLLPELPPIPRKPHQGQRHHKAASPPAFGQAQPVGALTGKTIFLSQSHGWYWHTQFGWLTQRPNTNDIVEDFVTPELINQYLVQYLWNAGADVWTCRERDLNTQQIIVDNDQADGYSETGAWQTGSLPGFGGTYRMAISPTAMARWQPTFLQEGDYAVYAWYVAGSNRSSRARFEINHGGGQTVVLVNQQVHGSTWRYLGTYYFRAGRSGSVTLVNESGAAGDTVIADAIRFGGGMGSIARGGTTSQRPRWEEAARYFAEFQGAPPQVFDPLSTGEDRDDDVTARPRYAEWEKEPGEDAVYISLHTNAAATPNTGTGTETYIHNTAPSPGSALLQQAVHQELINDIRQGWDANWRDRGLRTANFGELRLLTTMPGVLIELAFHDTSTPDAQYLREPLFRQLAARAIYQGIVKYFEQRDRVDLPLLPEPPTHLTVHNTDWQEVTISWRPPQTDRVGLVGDQATSYKVYTSADGKAFDNGVATSDTSLTLTGLTPGRVYYFRVTALNDGGESFPTEVLAVKVAAGVARPAMLVVNGFDRLDRFALIPRFESGPLGTVRRMFLQRMNTYDYIIEHATAIDAHGVAFDSCSNEAVRDGIVSLADYRVIDWILGEESTAHETFDTDEQERIRQFLMMGGSLFVSGSEIAWDLDQRGSVADRSFYRNFLQARYAGDDSDTHTVTGTGGIFADIGLFMIDDGRRRYDVDSPDQLLPIWPATANLMYVGGSGGHAAIEYASAYKLVHFGFPFEAIVDAEIRRTIMARILTFFGL
ncbi:MAG: N-acetylmuramoyl-L-alanine amidase [Blastocatellia bacterium]|nr:N-acetylmuramoyl-L-alanine amidase [Blastocatellia bacterium]